MRKFYAINTTEHSIMMFGSKKQRDNACEFEIDGFKPYGPIKANQITKFKNMGYIPAIPGGQNDFRNL